MRALTDRSRIVVIKARVVRHGMKRAPLSAHLAYKYADGAIELDDVAGIEAKLDYANRAGFPRVVVPGVPEDHSKSDAEEESPRSTAEQGDGVDSVPAAEGFVESIRGKEPQPSSASFSYS